MFPCLNMKICFKLFRFVCPKADVYAGQSGNLPNAPPGNLLNGPLGNLLNRPTNRHVGAGHRAIR